MKRLLLPAVVLFLITACASTEATKPKTAEDYLLDGERLMESGRHQEAITSWQKVREAFYSPELNMLAELKIAEAHFQARDYVEAAAAYEDFLKQYPNHTRTAEALYRLGMSYYKQILSADRDQTATQNALVTFESLLRRFPDDSNNDEARTLIARCRDYLAERELYIGQFYLRTGKYPPAIKRLRDIPNSYPDFDKLDQVYFRLGQAHQLNGDRQQAAGAFETLVRVFPQSEHIREAQRFLELGN